MCAHSHMRTCSHTHNGWLRALDFWSHTCPHDWPYEEAVGLNCSPHLWRQVLVVTKSDGSHAITDTEPWEFKDGQRTLCNLSNAPTLRVYLFYLPSGPFEWHFNEQTPCRPGVTQSWFHLDTYSGFAWCAILHCTVWSDFQNIFTESSVIRPSSWAHGVDWLSGRLGQAVWLSWVVLCQP